MKTGVELIAAEYAKNRRLDLLAKAGALIAAEIDRLQRAETQERPWPTKPMKLTRPADLLRQRTRKP